MSKKRLSCYKCITLSVCKSLAIDYYNNLVPIRRQKRTGDLAVAIAKRMVIFTIENKCPLFSKMSDQKKKKSLNYMIGKWL